MIFHIHCIVIFEAKYGIGLYIPTFRSTFYMNFYSVPFFPRSLKIMKDFKNRYFFTLSYTFAYFDN